jgi:hypothetical protein
MDGGDQAMRIPERREQCPRRLEAELDRGGAGKEKVERVRV